MFRIMVKIQPSTICQVAAKKCVCNINRGLDQKKICLWNEIDNGKT